MSRGRKQYTAGHVNALHLEQDASYLSAMITDGPAGSGGRNARVFMDDDTLRGLLAHLATDTRWSAAFDAVIADRAARETEAAQTRRITPDQLASRERLAEAMRSAMTARDSAFGVMLSEASQRRQVLQAASRPDATDEEVEAAVDLVQGTQTQIRARIHTGRPPACEHCGQDIYLAGLPVMRWCLTGLTAGLHGREAAVDCRKSPTGFHAPSSDRSEGSRPDRAVLGIAGLAAATTLDESYGALVTIGGAFMRAGQGVTTEVREDDGSVVALITPPDGPS
jgi:hypothetical protein